MRRKIVLVLIAIMGLMVTLIGIPSSAKRAPGKQTKARIQGLKPEVRQAVGFAKTTTQLRNMPAEQNRLPEGTPREINEENEELNRVQPPGAPTNSVDNAIRGGGNNATAVSVTPPPIGSFEALADTDNTVAGLGLVNPPDTNADVGYTQIVETVNSVFRVYDKSGAPLTPVLKQSTLFAPLGGICAEENKGDPIVLHDRIADRWQISQFAFRGALPTTPPYHQCIAISQTSDAAGDYYIYDFQLPGVEFQDYPKLGVWPDAYYMTGRQFTMGGPFNGIGAFAFNRQKMLEGDPTAELIYFSIPNDANYPSNSSSGMIPSDHDGLLPPPPGAPNVFAIYDSDEFGGTDSLRLFDFHADFAPMGTPTFTERTESPLAVPAFDDRNPSGRADIEEPAPGENLDSIGDRLMFRLAYRNRGGVESLVTNHTVNVSGVSPTSAANYQAASRYYELRKSNPGDPYAVYDAATYSPDAGNGATGINRWMGSTAIDNQGNLAMGYSASSTALLPSIEYVGRAFDMLGASLTNEQLMFAGQGTMGAGDGNRWGDYSSMSVDPTDDCTFWYAQEYWPAGNTTFNWHTRIGDFKFPTCTPPAQGTLTGTITACDSGAPEEQVLIQVTGGPSNGYSAVTADDNTGNYTIHLAPGTYTVTASAAIRNCQAGTSSMVTITDGGTTTYSTCLNGTAKIALDDDNPPMTVVGGNGNGQIDKNECNTLSVLVENEGCAPARNVSGTLSTTTPGVTITQPTSPYPNMPIEGTATNTIPFGINTSPSFVCGTPIVFTLTMTYTGGTDTQTFTLQTCNLPPQMFSGTVDPTDPDGTNGRLGRNTASTCAGKPCPGPLGTGPRSYETHSFVNGGGVAACATIDTASGCGTNIVVSAYLNSFDPSNLCTNYLGDGATATNAHFSVTVPAGQTLIVVVMSVANNTTTCPYTGTVSGLIGDIDGGGQCADLSVTKDDTPDPVLLGDNITYDIKVTNNGPGDATGVMVKDTLPSSATFVSVTTSQGSCTQSMGMVTCNLGNLANGAMATIQIVAKTHGNPNIIYNRVRVSSTSGDGNVTNDEDVESTRVLGFRKLSFSPNTVIGGCQDSTGTLLLTSPAGMGGLVVNLHSDNSHVHVPAMVTVPQGMTSVTFPAMTDVVMSDQIATVTATAGSNHISGRLKVLAVRIINMTFSPNPVHGGQDSIATITLSCAPDEPITVRLTSNIAAARPVSPIVIPAGQSSGQATIHTLHVSSPRTAIITAYANGGYLRRNLTIIP